MSSLRRFLRIERPRSETPDDADPSPETADRFGAVERPGPAPAAPRASGADLDPLARRAEGFSGAEIEQAVVSALYDAFGEGTELEQRHLERAVAESLPLSTTMREEVARVREWARTRTRAASTAAPEPVPPAVPRPG